MNIFFTNKDTTACAQDHCSVHTVKMILEYSQLLSTTHRVLDDIHQDDLRFYKKTHDNHPSAIWVRESLQHYNWLVDLLLKLHIEYTLFTGKTHKSYERMEYFITPPQNIQDNGWVDPYIAINKDMFPDIHEKFNRDGDKIAAYKSYLNIKYFDWTTRVERGHKRNIKAYWYRNKPNWVTSV